MSSPPPDGRLPPGADFWYDYVDPASFLVDRTLRGGLPAPAPDTIRWRPLEVIPPDRPLLDPTDRGWLEHLSAMAQHADREGLTLRPPPLIPWTRKAHELAFHAREQGCFAAIHGAIFEGYFLNGLDIGRVDVLVDIAARHGIDRTTVRVVLDVDRFTQRVQEERAAAQATGVDAIPTLQRGGARLTGFQDPQEIQDFLDAPLPR